MSFRLRGEEGVGIDARLDAAKDAKDERRKEKGGSEEKRSGKRRKRKAIAFQLFVSFFAFFFLSSRILLCSFLFASLSFLDGIMQRYATDIAADSLLAAAAFLFTSLSICHGFSGQSGANRFDIVE